MVKPDYEMVSGLLLANAENVAASVRSGTHPNPRESVIWQAAAMPRTPA